MSRARRGTISGKAEPDRTIGYHVPDYGVGAEAAD